jgi:hypothetical protein
MHHLLMLSLMMLRRPTNPKASPLLPSHTAIESTFCVNNQY